MPDVSLKETELRNFETSALTMIYSKEKNFLFIHIPKTAGTSIRSVLEPYGGKPGILNYAARQLENFPAFANAVGLNAARTYDSHTTFKRITHLLPAQELESLFIFSFVRHPFDRLYSFYLHVTKRPQHPWHTKLLNYGSFSNTMTHLNEVQEPTQKSYLTDDGGIIRTNFTGHFERIETDFKSICERLHIPFDLPKKNAREHRNWKEVFTDKDRQYGYDFYKEDFEAFGYDPDEK